MASEDINRVVGEIGLRHGRERWRLMDIVRDVQERLGAVGPEAVDAIAGWLGIARVEVEGVVGFYSFLSSGQRGRVVIRLCDDVIDRMAGYDAVRAAFEGALGVKVGETTPDGEFTLERTACIGMCDQAPAALVNDVVVTNLSSDKARVIVRMLRDQKDPSKLVHRFGDGNNSHPLVRSMVENNLRKAGPIVFSGQTRGEAIRKALAISPAEVIRAIKTSRLRGRGGAGFPTGMKWEFARAAAGDRKFVICNADEGEPGTFKDRVLLTELPDRVFAGLTIAAYAVGAAEGIVYLRAEYAYLRRFLEQVLEKRRADGLLGRSVCGKPGFDFDIRIQMGAGAYICGEETALINSCEGLRGEPRNRPPFPAQRGYLGCPTVVNNVETLACVTRILEAGPATFCERGTHQSSGTKLLSISGDCTLPGVYEVDMGITLREVLELCGGEDAAAVQVGGPSREMVGPAEFHRTIDYDDLATGGAVLVFGPDRNIVEIVSAFMEFFVHESCGFCTPCRVGTVLLKEKLDRVIAGRGEPKDLEDMLELAETIKQTSRCGLGQASPNPVLMTLRSFRPVYDALVKPDPHGYRRGFDLQASLREAERVAGRGSQQHQEGVP
ncbi:MAG: NAD-reducing hydrogenase HoxS subunit alpha [Phycisphaerales bacterium]|nr:NAD-reducing hydrogenase HoxS subunit alpha [Phycisphaerales bacterium]